MHIHGERGVGAAMPPEGYANLTGQACLGCKRNGVRLRGLVPRLSQFRVAPHEPSPGDRRTDPSQRSWLGKEVAAVHPAMAAGLTDHVWSLTEVLFYRVPSWPQLQTV